MSILHVFEQSGNGPAPYVFGGVTTKDNSCDHCGTAIKYNFHFTAADGKAFIVGSDCVLKAEGTVEHGIATTWKRKHGRELVKARKAKKTKALREKAFAEHSDLEDILKVDHHITRDIAARFAQYGSVSPRQIDLLRKLASEVFSKRLDKEVIKWISTKVPNIVEYFKAATSDEHGRILKTPSLTWNTSEGTIKVKMASQYSKRPGDFYVTDGGSYGSSKFYGWIDATTGAFEDRESPEWVTEFLVRFDANPIEVALEYGSASGRCCFCSKELTQAGSVAHGYGPICARNWNLPWAAKV